MAKKGLLAVMLMAGMVLGQGVPMSIKEDETPEQIKQKINLKKRIRLIEQGVKEFEIDGYKVHARDYKNALRKVNNLRHGK